MKHLTISTVEIGKNKYSVVSSVQGTGEKKRQGENFEALEGRPSYLRQGVPFIFSRNNHSTRNLWFYLGWELHDVTSKLLLSWFCGLRFVQCTCLYSFKSEVVRLFSTYVTRTRVLKEMEEEQLNGSVAEGSAAQMNIQTTKKLKKPKGVFINYYISQCKLNMKNKAKMTFQARRELGEKWKQLSLEEKEPFIKQTIKQRNQYKQELEEGFDGYKKEKVVSTRCSPLNLFKLFEQLKERKKETVVHSVGFGSLLQLKGRNMRRGLCRYLAENFDLESCSIKFNGQSIPLTVEDVEGILGLKNEGVDVSTVLRKENGNALAKRYKIPKKITFVELERQILKLKVGSEDLKARVLLYIVGRFLCPKTRANISEEYFSCLCADGLNGKLNWAKHTHEMLLRAIQKYSARNGKGTTYLTGCLPLLEVIRFYDHVFGVQSKQFGKSNFVPRISVWGKYEAAKLSRTKDFRTTLETKSTEEGRQFIHDEIQNMDFGKAHHRKSSTESPSMAKSVPQSNNVLVIDDDGKGNHRDLYTTNIVSIEEPCSVCPSPRKRKAEKKNCLIEIPTKVGDLERALCNYIWNSGVDGSEIVLNYGVTYATIDEFESLRPEKWVTSNIIDLSALMVAYKSKDMPISTKKCFFPSTFATHILSHECTANEVIKFYQCHFNQMGSLSQYDQVFIPINEGNEHWYLCVIDMLHMEAKLLDSLPLRRGNTERRKVVARLISCCETLFKDPLMISTLGSLVVPFEDLKIVVPEGVPFQSNGYDCGMFVIKFMQHLPTENYCSVCVKPWDRFLLLYEIINHKENMCRGKVCKAAMKLQNRRQSPRAKQDCKSVVKFKT
ncbi:hypothetical protein GQ457_01G047670 [Hibiscus cannabinus]